MLEVIAFIEDRKVVRKSLEHLGISTAGPPQAPFAPTASAQAVLLSQPWRPAPADGTPPRPR